MQPYTAYMRRIKRQYIAQRRQDRVLTSRSMAYLKSVIFIKKQDNSLNL